MSLSQILTVIRSRSIKIRSEDSAIDLQPLAMRTVIIQQSALVRQSPFGCLLIASNAPSLFVGVVQSLMLGILQEDSGTTYGNLNDCIIIKLAIKYSNIDSSVIPKD
jgi:hypothetical protein